ncbi:MAG: hypothetical protein U9Q70_06970 [Chloroflexota bacterium]|nr:hypothetical protein [Chloroflexota bacterium]
MNTKIKVMLIGGIIGAAVGTLAGLLYYNSAAELDEKGQAHIGVPHPQEALKLSVGVLGLLRSLSGA